MKPLAKGLGACACCGWELQSRAKLRRRCCWCVPTAHIVTRASAAPAIQPCLLQGLAVVLRWPLCRY